MGGGRFSRDSWSSYTSSKSYSTKNTDEIYSRSFNNALNPKGVKIRESRDGDDNPVSNAIIIGLDVTGSMSMVLDSMARQGLPTLVDEIYKRKPVSDPHIMCMGIGDVECDRAPLQITQFEADIRIAQQLEMLYLERGGGGNDYESYTLAWYFAAANTSIDCFEKRGKKGYLFTVGDEEPTKILRASDIEKFLGSKVEKDFPPQDLLAMVNATYNVYHLMVAEGSHYRSAGDKVREKWTNLLGQRALLLTNHKKMSEVIVSTIQINEGENRDKVIASWDKKTSAVVGDALRYLDF